jgi:hypothetical protein
MMGGEHVIMVQLLLEQVNYDESGLDAKWKACHEARQARVPSIADDTIAQPFHSEV